MVAVTTTLIVGILFFTGCTTVGTVDKASAVLVSSVNIKYYYENGELVDLVLKMDLTEQELETLIAAMDSIDGAKNTINNIADDPSKLILNINSVVNEYLIIKDAYLEIREIVISHQSDFNDSDWGKLKSFDQSVLILNGEFVDLVTSAELPSALQSALRFADTAYKLSELL
jgi:hypothetical protein